MAASSRSRTGVNPSSGKLAAKAAPMVLPASVTDVVADQAPASSPNSVLVEQQIRTLADLCEALDRKCMELLDELSTCRQAIVTSDTSLADARQEFYDYRSASERRFSELSELRDQEQAAARLLQTTLERDLASVRDALNRAAAAARSEQQEWRRPEGQAHASRLLPILNSVLAAGEVRALHDTLGALAQYGAAGMVDSFEGTRDAPICNGWLLSRSDMNAEPLIFLMDDNGMLAWTEGNRERLDVNTAFQNTKPRPGFKTLLPRVPIGRVRAIVAIFEADVATVVFFESASHAVPPGIFLPEK